MNVEFKDSTDLRWVQVDSDGSALTGTLPDYSTRLNNHWTDVPRSNVYEYFQKVNFGDTIKTQFTTDATTITIKLYDQTDDTEENDYSGTEVSVYSYNDSNNEIYNFDIDTSSPSILGFFYIRITFTDGITTQYWQCEYFTTESVDTNKTVKIEWGTSKRLGAYNPLEVYGLYSMRLESRFFKPKFGGDKETYTDSDYEFTLQDGAPIFNIMLELGKTPFFIAEKLLVALQHETFKINGIEYQAEDDFSPDIVDEGVDTTNLMHGSLLLRKKVYQSYTSIRDDIQPIIPRLAVDNSTDTEGALNHLLLIDNTGDNYLLI